VKVIHHFFCVVGVDLGREFDTKILNSLSNKKVDFEKTYNEQKPLNLIGRVPG